MRRGRVNNNANKKENHNRIVAKATTYGKESVDKSTCLQGMCSVNKLGGAARNALLACETHFTIRFGYLALWLLEVFIRFGLITGFIQHGFITSRFFAVIQRLIGVFYPLFVVVHL